MGPVDRRLLGSARVAAAALGVAVGLGLATAALAVAQAGLLARAIAGATDGLDVAALAGPLAALAAVLVARAALGWLGETTAQRIAARIKSDLRRRLLGRAVTLGPHELADRRSGEIVLLATRGLDALDGYFARYLPQLALAAIVPVAVVACLLAIDLVAALTVALTVPLIPVFMALVGSASAARRRRRWDALVRLGHRFLDVVAGLPTLRAYGRAEVQVAHLRGATDAWRQETLATLRVAFLSALVLELLATVSVALVAVGVGLRLVDGSLDLETGLFVIVLAPEAYLPLRRLGADYHASEEGLAAASAAFEVIEMERPAGGTSRAVPDLRGGSVRVEGVAVVQPGREVAAPAPVSFVARSGEVVAIRGGTGAGKSTLLAVILGLVPPTSGRVVVVGADGAEADVASFEGDAWRRHVAWVPQVPFLVPGTVADNVRLGAPEAGDEAVRGALAAVGLAHVGPGAVVGERGAGVSSGERRRIGVARALVRRAALLLLDEPTAGLDPDAEAAVLAAVRREAARGAVVVLVAHRPAAIAAADRVVDVTWRSVEPVEPARPAHHTVGPDEPTPAVGDAA